jgi:hypothetical protein
MTPTDELGVLRELFHEHILFGTADTRTTSVGVQLSPRRVALVMTWPLTAGFRIFVFGEEEVVHYCDSLLQTIGVIRHYLGGINEAP